MGFSTFWDFRDQQLYRAERRRRENEGDSWERQEQDTDRRRLPGDIIVAIYHQVISLATPLWVTPYEETSRETITHVGKPGTSNGLPCIFFLESVLCPIPIRPLVHDHIQCFDDVKVDFIAVISNAGPPTRDGTHTVYGRSSEPRYTGDGEKFGHERWRNDYLSQRIRRGGQWMSARI
jgi:hypothetical protein